MINHLTMITTLRCDLKCQHCLRGYADERPDFPLELLDKLLVEALPFGANHVALTGGEPHLHPQFEQLVEKIVAYGYTWHFVSNGQQTEPYLPLMEKYRESFRHVTLSIDGATAKTHDELRQRPGAFEKVVAAARRYVELGYKVRLSSTLNQKNQNELADLVELGAQLGAYALGFAGTIPTPWNQELVLSDQEALELYQQSLALRRQVSLELQTVSSLHTRGGVNFCNILNLCELAFNSRGELIFCCDTTENGAVIGALREFSLAHLIKRWLVQSSHLQAKRAEWIAAGKMGEKFDTCRFCNNFLKHQNQNSMSR